MIKNFVKKGYETKEIHANFQTHWEILLSHIQLFSGGPLTLNLVARTQKIIVEISSEWVYHILTDELGMKKIIGQRVQKQKKKHERFIDTNCCHTCLQLMKAIVLTESSNCSIPSSHSILQKSIRFLSSLPFVAIIIKIYYCCCHF